MAWTRGPVIGRGSSATVSIATTFTGEIFAVKSCELSSSACISLQKDQNFLSQLCSCYIVDYMGCEITCENNKSMYNVLMEYMPGGSLADFAKKQSFGSDEFNESLVRVYAYQILKGLEYLHSLGIVHCDIKGQNILIGNNSVKIADLGCAKMVEKDGNKIISGTPLFMAPEVARGEEQEFPADIWSLGCTILELITGNGQFWPGFTDPVSALYRIGHYDNVPSIPSFLSDNAKDFLGKCFIRDPKERRTAKQLLHHPFFNGVVDISPEQISPTSILDQVFWVSGETAESSSSSSSSSDEKVNSLCCSPADRIKKMGFSSDSISKLPIWEDDETWLTIFQQNSDVNEELADGDGSEIEVGVVASDSDSENEFSLESYYFDDEVIVEPVIVHDDLLFSQFIDDINFRENSLAFRNISPLTISDIVTDDFIGINDLEGNARDDFFCAAAVIISMLYRSL